MENYGQISHRSRDDSYVITKNNLPYHVPNEGTYVDEWIKVQQYAKEHPEMVIEEEPFVSPIPTIEELAASIRAERNKRLILTDHLVMPDYPLDEDKRNEVRLYRQAFRDLPQQEGFPWNGVEDPNCSWPKEPVL